jgi:carbon monoxide dehydrogenase subunit G
MEDVRVQVVRELDAPADAVWAVVSDFGNVDWAMPGAQVDVIGEGIGMIRRLHTPGGAVEEKLETCDAETRSFSYSIPGPMPMPVTDFRAWVQLTALDAAHTRVEWNASAKALPPVTGAEGQAIFEGLYGGLIDALTAHVTKAA